MSGVNGEVSMANEENSDSEKRRADSCKGIPIVVVDSNHVVCPVSLQDEDEEKKQQKHFVKELAADVNALLCAVFVMSLTLCCLSMKIMDAFECFNRIKFIVGANESLTLYLEEE